MKEQLKGMARPYAMLFMIALAVAIVGRIGLAVMDLTGTLSYDYISAADVPILDVVCSILTGAALVAFMYAASLAMVVSTAGARREARRLEPGARGFRLRSRGHGSHRGHVLGRQLGQHPAGHGGSMVRRRRGREPGHHVRDGRAGEEGSRVAWNPGRASPVGQGEARPSFRKYPSVRRVGFRRAGRARFP